VVPPSTIPIIIVGVAVGVAVRVAVAVAVSVAVAVAVGVRDGTMVKVGVKLGVAVFLVVVEQDEHGSHPVPRNRVATAKNRQMASPAHREIIVGLLPVSPKVGRAGSFPPVTPARCGRTYFTPR
jgi:hypothetical protein